MDNNTGNNNPNIVEDDGTQVDYESGAYRQETNRMGTQALALGSLNMTNKPEYITLEDVSQVLPKNMGRYFTESTLQLVNETLDKCEHAAILRENIIAYSNVFTQQKTSMNAYLNAVQYATYKLAGLTNMDAWIKTFPDTYQRMVATNKSSQIPARVSIYNSSKIVVAIMEQAMIPAWLMNIDAYQEAIATQVEIMRTAKSEKVRSDAANSLLNHLKAPEKGKMQLDITVNQKNFIGELREVVNELVDAQEGGIKSGNNRVIDVAEYSIVRRERDSEVNGN